MDVSRVADTAFVPPPIFLLEPIVRTPSTLKQRQIAASTAQVVREPGGKYVAVVSGATVTGSSVQSVQNGVNSLLDVFA